MMIARNLRRRCASNSRNSDAPSSVQIRKCPIQPRQYSFSSSKQAFSDCPQERGVSSRILVLSLALVLVDSLTLTWPPSPILNRNPKKWTFSGEVTELFSSLIWSRSLLSKNRRVESITLRPARSLPVSYTHLRAHETRHDLVCRLL